MQLKCILFIVLKLHATLPLASFVFFVLFCLLAGETKTFEKILYRNYIIMNKYIMVAYIGTILNCVQLKVLFFNIFDYL